MNRHTFCATFVATIGATFALASTTASAGKPPPPDPCASVNPNGFPSFVFMKNITVKGTKQQTWGAFVTDVTGRCQRMIGTSTGEKTVNMRYVASTGLALLVRMGTGFEFVGATVPISNPTGTQTQATFQTLLTGSQLQAISDPGWTLSTMGDASLSFDGSQMLFTAIYQSSANTRTVFWTCNLSPGPSITDATAYFTSCRAGFSRDVGPTFHAMPG